MRARNICKLFEFPFYWSHPDLAVLKEFPWAKLQMRVAFPAYENSQLVSH